MTDAAPPPGRMGVWWRVIRFLVRTMLCPYLGYRARGVGRVPEGGALLLSNHQSFLDPLLVSVNFDRDTSFLARDTLFDVPLLGRLLRRVSVIPVRREAATSLREPIQRLKAGRLVGVFPEGTRTPDGRVLEIKPGFIAMVRRTGVPIVPVGIAGAYESWPRDKRFPRPGRVRVVYGEPIPADEVAALAKKGREGEMLARVQAAIEAAAAEAAEWRREATD